MAIDSFTSGIGEGVADARRELIEKAWFGQAEPRAPHHDHGLTEQPSLSSDAERGFLGWLKAEWPSATGHERATQDRSLHPDAGREHDAARHTDLSPDERGIDR